MNAYFDFNTDFLESMVETDAFTQTRVPVTLENRSHLTRRRDTYPFIDPTRFRNKLTGKIVLITQAHRGIGRASAIAFAEAGASVCCVGPTAECLASLLREIKERFGTPTLALSADLSEPNAAFEVVDLVEKHRGPIDILVNITGVPYVRPFYKETDIMKDWWPSIEANLKTPISLIHAVLPSMIERGTGTIMTTVLATAVINLPFMSAHGASASALLKFHQQLHQEVADKGLFVFPVNPGPVPSHVHNPEEASKMVLKPEDMRGEPLHEEMIGIAARMAWPAAGLASGTFVCLAADSRARCLNGLYVNAERDLEELLSKMEKDQGRKCQRERLYQLKVDEI